MAQHATPIADTANTDELDSGLGPWWSDHLGSFVDIYQAVAQSSPPDDSSLINDTVSIPPLPGGTRNIYVTKLGAISDPAVDTGHILRVRAMTLGLPGTLLLAQLRQGYVSEAGQGTLIESFSPAMDSFQQTFDLNISAANAALITDYSNLFVRIGNVGDAISQIPWIDLEVPDPASRAIVSWAVLEVPRPDEPTMVVENRGSDFNSPLLLEELAAAELAPSPLVMAGFDVQANGYLWVPITAPRDVPPDGIAQPGDLRLYYSFNPTSADRVTIDAVLDAHNPAALTLLQQAEANDAQELLDLIDGFNGFLGLTEFQQDQLLRLAVRRLIRQTGFIPSAESAADPRNKFAQTASVAGLNLIPAPGDPSTPEDGDLWYNVTTGKFRKRQAGATSDMAGGGGGASVSQATVNLPYPAKLNHVATVVDAAVTPASRIMVSLAGLPDTAVNTADMADVESLDAVAGSGQFALRASFRAPNAGPLVINYIVG